MDLQVTLNEAIRSLRCRPARTSLTALGIVIGVAAIVTTTSIGNGAKAQIELSLSKPGTRNIYLSASSRPERKRRAGGSGVESLTVEDFLAIKSTIVGLEATSPRFGIQSVPVQGGGRNSTAQLDAFDVDGFALFEHELVLGAFFDASDVRDASGTSLISQSLASELFRGDDDPVGRTVRVRGIPFTIVGVLADKPVLPGMPDLRVYLPFTSLLRRIDRRLPMSITLQARQIQEIPRIEKDLNALLDLRRGSRKLEFHILSPVSSLQAYTESSGTLAILLGSIASVSLIVGGVGIMNMMLVGVAERTREIGIRVAIGTYRRDILLQFLIESMLLSLLGGVLGIVIGSFTSWAIAHFNGWIMRVTVDSILIATLGSALLGALFGYFPARAAARLDPIQALRAE